MRHGTTASTLLLGLVVGVVVGWWGATAGPLPGGTAVDQALLDSLRRDTEAAQRERDSVLVQYAADSVRAVQEAAARQAAVAAARRAQAQAEAARAQLAAQLPMQRDSAEAAYAAAVQAADSALSAARKWEAQARRDSVELARSQAQEYRLRVAMQATAREAANAVSARDEWERKYQALAATQRRCGMKCGVTLGVVGTIGAAWAIRQVAGNQSP